MAITFISKGEADMDKVKLAFKQQNTEVLFRNRFGREVIIREYEANKMVRRGEGEIVKVIGELQKKRKKKEAAKKAEPKGDK